MSKRDDIITFSADTTSSTRFEDIGQIAKGKAARLGEVREGAFAALVLGIGFGTAIVRFFNLAFIPNADMVIITSILFGTIEIPRLEEINVFVRLILLMTLLGTMLLFTREILGAAETSTVAFATLGLLFIASLINATAQAGIGPTGTLREVAATKYAPYLGLMAALSFITLL